MAESTDTTGKGVVPDQVDAGGTPVRKRIASAEVARSIYDSTMQASRLRVARLARIKGTIDGNPPWDSAELTRLGQGWRANFSTREGRAAVRQSADANWELHCEVPTLIEVSMSPIAAQTLGIPPEVRERWCNIVASEYTAAMNRWTGFYSNVWRSSYDMFSTGVGGMTWVDGLDWRPVAFRSFGLKIPNDAPADIDRLDIIQVDFELSLSEMFKYISDESAARSAGWNVTAVRTLLIDIFKNGYASEQTANLDPAALWAQIQRDWVEGNVRVQGREHEMVCLVQTLAKELQPDNTWKVSRLIHSQGHPHIPFLFEKRGEFEGINNALWVLTYECGDHKFHSIKGLGHEVAAYSEYSNQFTCMGLDGAAIAASLLLQAKQAGLNSLDVLRLGPVTLLPPDVNVLAANNFAPPIGGLIQMRGMMRDILHSNSGIFRVPDQNTGRDTEVQKSARQISSEDAREARFEKNRTYWLNLQWTKWHQEVFRRITNQDLMSAPVEVGGKKEAMDFAARCVAQGVPLVVLVQGAKVFDVVATQALGMGSQGARMDITNRLMGARPSMGAAGRRWVERYWAATMVSWKNVDRVFPELGSEIPTREEAIAAMENNDFEDGRDLDVIGDQEDERHLSTHLPWAIDMVDKARAAQDPEAVVVAAKALAVALPHCAQHLARIAPDPSRQEQVLQFKAQLEGLGRVARGLQSAADRIQASHTKVEAERSALLARASQMVADQTLEIERLKAEGKMQIEAAKNESIMHVRQMKEEHAQALKTQRQDFEQRLAVQDQAFKQQLELLKASRGGPTK